MLLDKYMNALLDNRQMISKMLEHNNWKAILNRLQAQRMLFQVFLSFPRLLEFDQLDPRFPHSFISFALPCTLSFTYLFR